MAKSKKATKKSVKPVRPGKSAKKNVKPARPGKAVKKSPKKSANKSVKKAVKRGARKSSKTAVRKPASATSMPVRSLLSVNELPEGESRRVMATVKDAIAKNTEEHPFYDSAPDKETVIVSREVEFVDTERGVYMIPRGVTISIVREGRDGAWLIQRHTD